VVVLMAPTPMSMNSNKGKSMRRTHKNKHFSAIM